ncbi:MAG: chemotaxis protein CheW [Synechococcaceae cyanobacterium]|nr:chemotaxis protein CheW [Synechococcaceae cyanobacterium]
MPVPPAKPGTAPASLLLLLFSAGGQLYAIESKDVVEVIPRVSLRPAMNLPSSVSGVFNYRGVVVPVVDLGSLIHGCCSGPNLSTRIIMVAATGGAGVSRTVGLLSEGVTDTLTRPLSAFQMSSLRAGHRPYLGGVTLDERGLVQILHLEVLLAEILGEPPPPHRLAP